MANAAIGVKGWRNYSSFSLFGGGSQRADRGASLLTDTYSGNVSVIATDWNLAARIPCSISRAYNHQDSTSGVDRPFGPGWYWQFDMNLTGSLDGTGTTTLKSADGSEYDFTSPTTSGSYKVYTSPDGMHDYLLRYHTGSAYFELLNGTITYRFNKNTTDSPPRARLVWIRDAFGNGLEISRVLNLGGEPTATITGIAIRYHNGTTWTTQNIVTPTYSGTLITKLQLDETLSGGSYIDLHYTYSSIDGADRLTKVEPKRGSTALNIQVEYGYNTGSGLGLQLTKLYDTNGARAGTPYYWEVTYSSNKAATVVFPIDSAPTTGTVTYTYNTSSPTSWGHASPSAWNKVTDAEGGHWFYGQDSSGRTEFAVDPLWVNSSHESYTEYAYNSDNQVTSFKTPRPNAESGQLTTAYKYNADKHLSAVVDVYGFVSWFIYGTRADYETSGTGATKKEVIGIFTPMPGVQAYSDTDHTSSQTAAPTLSGTIDPASYVSWDSTNLYWKYTDGSGSPKTIKLVRTVSDYTFATGTGQLTELLTCSPENFAESSATTYDLTSASGCSKQEYNSTVGDLYRTYTPRQFLDSSLKYSQFAYDQVHGSLTRSANADGVASNPTTPDATVYEYDATGSLVTKVKQPVDPTDQYVQYTYDDRWYRTQVKKEDIGSWGVDPITNVTIYDDNGNVTQQWVVKPFAAVPPILNPYTGNIADGSYVQPAGYTYDRLNRVATQDTNVDWDQDATIETLTSTFQYDKNGNLLRQRGPAYDDGGTTKYSYNFMEYDDANRLKKAYNTIASASSNLGSVTGGTKFTENSYDLLGNVTVVYDQAYTSGDYHHTDFSYDWLGRQIQTTAKYNAGGTPTARTTKQYFDASGAVRYNQDGLTHKMFPEYDLNGRLWKNHRTASNGEADERVYDDNGNLLYYYTYKDVNTDSSLFRWRYKYDRLDRRVNDGREQYTGGSWSNWNQNTADTEFDLNGNLLKSYDKVNSGKYTERTYDDWLQLKLVKAPAVPNPAGGGDIVYETENFYDIRGQRKQVEDHRGNSTYFYFDELGRTIKVKDAKNYETITYFDERGNTKEVHRPSGAITKYRYNDRNLLDRLRVTHDSTDDDTTYTYDDEGQQTQIDHPDGGVTKFEYDALHRRTKVRVLLSGSDYLDTTFTYNLNNQVLVTTLPGAYTITNTYSNDVLSLLTKVEDTNSDDTDYTYDKDNRRATEHRPNDLVTTWSYDWKTMQVASIQQELDTTSGNDITVTYTYDDNGQPTAILDGNNNIWSKAYDALLRMTSLSMPNTNAHTITYDGNGNITKTVDFKAQSHYYAYDELNRMTGHGTTSGANDETYTWSCCSQLTAYTDALGTASISYDDLSRITSFTDSLGNTAAYVYDAMGRTSTVTPAQGSNYKTDYAYNRNGSLASVDIYVAGTAETTSYTYNTTSGKLTQRNLPVVSGANIRTTYAYDSAGRLEYETVTSETGGGTTNLHKTQYAYAYIPDSGGGGRSLTRTEQTYSGGWVNANKVLYEWNALEWMRLEQRHDWNAGGGGSWVAKYDVNQEYDKRGNRTRYDKNVQGLAAEYGISCDLAYTFDASSLLSQITDANDATYNCAVTCDANNNITALDETTSIPGLPPQVNHVYTYFDVDPLNRVTAHRTKFSTGVAWMWTKRTHDYDGLGRLVRSGWKQWPDGSSEPGATTLEHTYDQQGKHLQNYDGTNYGKAWHWAGAEPMPETRSPLKSPNADTNQSAYNLADNVTPQRRTYVDPATPGDQRHEWGQGRPQAKDASGGGTGWATGTTSVSQGGAMTNVESRLMFEGTVSTNVSLATDAREKGRLGIFGTGISYAGGYGRVTSETIGRDINPLGRGDGMAYVAGWMNLGKLQTPFPLPNARVGVGSSINNECCDGPEGVMTEKAPPEEEQDPPNPGRLFPPGRFGRGDYPPPLPKKNTDCDCGGLCEAGAQRAAERPNEWAVNECCGRYNDAADACDCVGEYNKNPDSPEEAILAQGPFFKGWCHFNLNTGRIWGEPLPTRAPRRGQPRGGVTFSGLPGVGSGGVNPGAPGGGAPGGGGGRGGGGGGGGGLGGGRNGGIGGGVGGGGRRFPPLWPDPDCDALIAINANTVADLYAFSKCLGPMFTGADCLFGSPTNSASSGVFTKCYDCCRKEFDDDPAGIRLCLGFCNQSLADYQKAWAVCCLG